MNVWSTVPFEAWIIIIVLGVGIIGFIVVALSAAWRIEEAKARINCLIENLEDARNTCVRLEKERNTLMASRGVPLRIGDLNKMTVYTFVAEPVGMITIQRSDGPDDDFSTLAYIPTKGHSRGEQFIVLEGKVVWLAQES